MEERKERGGGRRPSLLVQFGLGGEGARGLPWQPLPLLHIRPIRPINPPGGSGNPSGTPVLSEASPEPFWCPNIVIQYINLYVSTISRLLVMFVITSGTPNNLRYIKMHKLIITVIVTLSVRTLRFENNVDMTETRLLVNNQ